jgi:hypothetical protein
MRVLSTFSVTLAIVTLAAYQASAATPVPGGSAAAGAMAGAGSAIGGAVGPTTPGPTATQAQGATSSGAIISPIQGVPSNPVTPSPPAVQMQSATSTQPAVTTTTPGLFPNNSIYSGGGTTALRANAQTAITNTTNPAQQWRYQFYNNQWWCLTPQNSWMVNGLNGWSYANTNANTNSGYGYTVNYGGVPVATPVGAQAGSGGNTNVPGGNSYPSFVSPGMPVYSYPNHGFFPNSSGYFNSGYFGQYGMFGK